MRTLAAASSWHRPLGLLGIAILVAACGATPASPSPSAPASASSPTVSSPTVSPTIAPTATATASPTMIAPTPTPSASAAEACPIPPQTGRLPSDRLVDVKTSSTPTADLVTFVFGNMSVPEPPQGASEGLLQAAEPPYTEAGSGAEIDFTDMHVAQVRFSGMSLSNDAGELTYDGPLVMPVIDYPTLAVVHNYDMSEGVIGWYIGYIGNGCVTLSSDAHSVTVAIDHPAS